MDVFESQGGATVEDRGEAERDPRAIVRFWRDQIALADAEEKHWRKRAKEAVDLYADAAAAKQERRKGARFNILFANVETIVPALYNSAPVPDVRRRFGDADPVGRVASQMLERALSYSADEYDLDAVMQAVVLDMQVPGRGIARVRYDPTIGPDGMVADQSVRCEPVFWADFRRGPGRTWDDVPWIAFRHALTRDELRQLAPDVADRVPLGMSVDRDRDQASDPKREPDVYKRAGVWEIWEKERREVIFIADGFDDAPVRAEPDPLRLRQFYPIPRPLVDVHVPGDLTPVEPFRMYADQAHELERITRRIAALIEVCKARGIYAADLGELSTLDKLEDGEMRPAQDAVTLAAMAGGSLDRAVWLWPVEKVIEVLNSLYVQRDQIKATIYEITGISDILRGASQASETATAQSIKAQWGSLRIQRRQAEVQRFARDLFRIMAELMAEHFDPALLAAITGIRLPTSAEKMAAQQAAMAAQAAGQPVPPDLAQVLEMPSIEEVGALLRSDELRSYRVDIETDSTVRADVARVQQNMGAFLQGFGQFVTAIGPAVQSGAMPQDVVASLLTAFARPFRLGRQAEDALEKLGQMPPRQPAGPSPEMMAIEAKKIEAEGKKADASVMKANIDLEKAKVEAAAMMAIPQPFAMAPVQGPPQPGQPVPLP